MATDRIKAATKLFEKNFNEEGDPKSLKGMLLVFKYGDGHICWNCHYRKQTAKAIRYLWRFVNVFKKGSREKG